MSNLDNQHAPVHSGERQDAAQGGGSILSDRLLTAVFGLWLIVVALPIGAVALFMTLAAGANQDADNWNE